ncbi:hypothetical protein D8S78_13300 [Natrialba swarupiae]|nr:hypothetical protein [Natrialba swarupiae]
MIHSYEYDGESETMQIEATWVGSSPTTVTLTEMIELDSEGSTDISFQEQRLSPDESVTIEMGAEQRSGGTAAILVSTPQSVDNGNALVLQAGDAGGSTPIPFSGRDPRRAGLCYDGRRSVPRRTLLRSERNRSNREGSMSRFDDVDVREPQYYIDEARRWLDNNRRVALVAGAVIAIAWWRGYLTLPPWWTIGVIAAAAAALVGWLTGKRTYEELNEENGCSSSTSRRTNRVGRSGNCPRIGSPTSR